MNSTFKQSTVKLSATKQSENMKITTYISIFIILFLVAFAVNAKPMPSLSMKMNWNEGVSYEQPVKIQVEVVSQISSESLNFKLNLPAGVTLMGGELSLQRKIEKGQPLLLDFTLFIEKNTAGKIEAEASIGGSAQIFFRAVSHLNLESPVQSKKSASRIITPPAFSHTERNGVKLREYQLP